MASDLGSSQYECGTSGKLARASKVVVSRGNPSARLMFIGEAPGAKEDELAIPFVGRSGKVLDHLFEAVGIDSSNDVYICNVVKCRPPNNRRPTREELQSSLPWLHQQIKLVDPWVILLAGSTSVEALLGIKTSMSKLRGVWQHWEGRLIMPLFHPAYLLRNPSMVEGKPRSLTQADLIKVRQKLNSFESIKDMQNTSDIGVIS